MKLTLKPLRRTTLAISVAALSLLGLAPAVASAAGTATLSFSPSSGKVVDGDTLAVAVYENSGTDAVNAAQANFTYSDSDLTFVSINSSSAFNIAAQSTGGSGSVKIGRGAMPAVSGKQLIATVYFKVIKSSGTATLDFDTAASKVVRSSDNQSESLSAQNASFTLSAASSGSQSGGSGSSGSGSTSGTKSSGSGNTSKSSSSSSSSSSSTTKSTPAQTKSLTISGVSISNVSASTATIKWTTSVPATSEVDYGTTASYGLSVVSSQLATNHSVNLSSKDLRASIVYHFAVKSVDANGRTVTSSDRTFETTADGSLNFGASSSQTSSYLWIALAAVAVIVIISAVAAWYIRRMHATAMVESHVFTGPTASTMAHNPPVPPFVGTQPPDDHNNSNHPIVPPPAG
ncbi:MAG TPA: hypothetical protein VHD84_03230 [Candidatus Saccharimonadales bacterium]|nr:hypothetical protein [Candidatus Saccharimonadales bacterium]